MINIKIWQIPTRNPECSVYLYLGELWYLVHQSIEDNLADTNTMLVLVVVVVVMVLTTPSEACVNSCCQTCLPDQCQVCYKLNNNPIMCRCIGEIGVTSAPVLLTSHLSSLGWNQTKLSVKAGCPDTADTRWAWGLQAFQIPASK